MTTKLVNLPKNVTFPVRILEVHVSTGQTIAAGDALYTLETADKKRGVIRAPFAGRISQGPVAPHTAFSEVRPVLGLDVAVSNVSNGPGVAPLRPDPVPAPEPTAARPTAAPAAARAQAPHPAQQDNGSSRHITEDLRTVVREEQKLAPLFDLGTFRDVVADQLVRRGHSRDTATRAAAHSQVEAAWRAVNPGKSKPQDATPPVIMARTLLIVLISFATGILGAIIGVALETEFPHQFTFTLGIYVGSIIAGAVWLVACAYSLPRGISEIARIVIIGIGLGVYTVTFIFVGPMADVGMPYIGQYLYQLTGYDPLAALNTMKMAQVLASVETAQSQGAPQKQVFRHWQELTYFIGLAFAMVYSLFWAVAPASVYARVQGVPEVRVSVIGRLLHFVIVGCLGFLLTSVGYVLLNPACTDFSCWSLQDYNGVALVGAIGCAMLLKLVSQFMNAR